MKNICFVTSTRADYGLLKGPMKVIKDSKEFNLQLIVTGAHLSEKFGSTYKEVEKDGFSITKKVNLGDLVDSNLSMALQVSKAVEGVSIALNELTPDLVIVLGDRYEILGAAQAAFYLKFPIMHLHGGEVTEGALDDSIRHSITKLSNYHVTSTQTYKERVIQLGEDPEKVFHLGSTGLENLLSDQLMKKSELQDSLSFSLKEQNLLITFHPVTRANETVEELIKALKNLPHVGQIITLPNSDPGHEEIRTQLENYAKNKENVFLTTSLGQLRYNSAMKLVDIVVGNSSSGIVEAPFCGTRTLNIGDRQKGRVMDPDKITSIPCDAKQISKSLEDLLNNKNYKKTPSFIYGKGDFSAQLYKTLLEIKQFSSKKSFNDLRK